MKRRNGRSFIGYDLFVANNTDDQLVTERTRLTQRVAVAVVHHVEAAVHVDADGPPFPERDKTRA